jgi:hypothetical protein
MRIFWLFILVCIVSCSRPEAKAREGEEARQYNDSLLQLWKTLEPSRAAWAEAISLSSPAVAGRAARQFVYETDTLIQLLRSFPDFEGDSTLRIALIKLAEASRTAAGRSSNTLSILLTDITIEEQPGDTIISADTITIDSADPHAALIPRYLSLTRKTEKLEQEAWLNFLNAQQEFSKRHGFVLPRSRNDSLWLEE